MPPARTRREDVERAKGLAILLVVFGHLVARAEPAGLTWYEPLRAAVYSFHMPFFMYLSGLAAGLAGEPAPGGTARWLIGRARRLLLPFVGFGLLILAGKLTTSGWLAVDHAPASLTDGLRALFWRTADSPAQSVWYLLVLFVYLAAWRLLPRAAGGRPWLAGAVAVALFAWPAPPLIYLDRIAGYAVFFVVGAGAAGSARWYAAVDRGRGWTLAGFAAALVLVVAGALPGGRIDNTAGRAVLLAVGLLSLPALHGLVRSGATARSAVLLTLGRASYAIYLLNTIVLGLAKGLLLLVLPWTADAFPLFAGTMMLAGTLGPLGLTRALAKARGVPPGPRWGLQPQTRIP